MRGRSMEGGPSSRRAWHKNCSAQTTTTTTTMDDDEGVDMLRRQSRLLSLLSLGALCLADAWAFASRYSRAVHDDDDALTLFLLGATATLWASPIAELAFFRANGSSYQKRSAVSLLLRLFAAITYVLAGLVLAYILLVPFARRVVGLKAAAAILGVTSNFLVSLATDRVDVAESPLPSGTAKSSLLFAASLVLFVVASAAFAASSTPLCIALGVLGAPLAHLGAFESMRESHGYMLWQPVDGGLAFMAAQGFAWLAYGLASGVLVTLSVNVNVSDSAMPLASALLLFAHATALCSKSLFVKSDDAVTPPRTVRKRKVSRSSIAAPRPLSRWRVVLALTALAGNGMVLWTRTISWTSLALSAVGALVVVHRIAPFTGGAVHVLEQAMGWTMLAITLLCATVLAANGAHGPWCVVVALVQLCAVVALYISSSNHAAENAAMANGHASNVSASSSGKAANADADELERLLAHAERPAVRAVLERARRSLSGEPELRPLSVVLCVIALVVAHGCLALFAFADLTRKVAVGGAHVAMAAGATASVLNALFAHGACGAALHPDSYSLVHPFRGGVRHVIPQAIGWTLLSGAQMGLVVAAHFGAAQTADGVIGALGVAVYVAQLVLLYSTLSFDPAAPHLGGAFSGGLLSILACALFLCVDLLIIAFGIPADLLVPVVLLAWLAVVFSAPLAYAYGESIKALDGSQGVGGFEVLGLAAWTFSVLLGLLVLGNANPDSVVWLATKTGAVNLVGHVLASGQARLVGGKLAYVLAVAVSTAVFFRVTMPLLRAFLDYPMFVYAYQFKRWPWARSPDGRQPLDGVVIHRNVHFGSNVLDILAPARPPQPTPPQDEQPPVVQVHGGGFMFCRRELTTHSMTPIARAAVMVYSVEYPLAPETPFPAALLTVLDACRFVAANHCRAGCLGSASTPLRCALCGPAPVVAEDAAFPCRCCEHERGTKTVQLLGDSAGGNLAAMAAAVLSNPGLLEQLAAHDGGLGVGQWALPKVQRLAVLYGVLGGDVSYNKAMEQRESFAWWLVEKASGAALRFLLEHYKGGSGALDGRVVLTDLESDLKDFAAETLLCCGRNDPLLATQTHAMHVIRRATGRSVKVVEYVGATHAFQGIPPQWNPRYKTDAFPATREVVLFLSGGATDIGLEPVELPWDWSPFIVFPGVIGGFIAVVWYTVGLVL